MTSQDEINKITEAIIGGAIEMHRPLMNLNVERSLGNYPGMLNTDEKTLPRCHSEEPVVYPATKNLPSSPPVGILRHSGAGKERPAPPFLRKTGRNIDGHAFLNVLVEKLKMGSRG